MQSTLSTLYRQKLESITRMVYFLSVTGTDPQFTYEAYNCFQFTALAKPKITLSDNESDNNNDFLFWFSLIGVFLSGFLSFSTAQEIHDSAIYTFQQQIHYNLKLVCQGPSINYVVNLRRRGLC